MSLPHKVLKTCHCSKGDFSIGSSLSPSMDHRLIQQNEIVEEKAAKIKRWVNARLQELELQNQRLRAQNILCTRRLELLQRCQTQSAEWKSNLMTCSAEGGRMFILHNPRIVETVEEFVEWPEVHQQRRTASVERMGANGGRNGHQTPIMTESACHSLPRNSSRNHLPTHNQQQTMSSIQKKPVPKPRSRLKEKQMGVSMIERDSLEPNSIYTDSFQYDPSVIQSGKPKWEKQLHQLAQSCFLPTNSSSNNKRDTYIPGDPKPESGTLKNQHQRISPPISVPVFCVYSGNERYVGPTGDSSEGSQRSSKEGRTSGSSTYHKITIGGDDRRSSSGNSHQSKGNQITIPPITDEQSSSDEDYALPPDATDFSHELDVKCLIQDGGSYDLSTSIKMSGYLNKMGNRTKSWKRRWFVLKDDSIRYYRAQNDQEAKDPVGTIGVSEIISLCRLSGSSSSSDGFEIVTGKGKFRLTTEETNLNEEWFKTIQKCRRDVMVKKVKEMSDGSKVHGWVTKVHFGRSKRYWCVLSGSTLLFYKRPSQQIPLSQLCLQNAQIKETPRSSEDESDTEDSFQINRQYSLELVTADGNNTYLLLPSAEEKERWMYHLTIGASGGANVSGTPFELLIHKLMEVDGNAESHFWKDPLISHCPEKPGPSLTKLNDDIALKSARGLYQSIYLFSTVPMQGGAVEYHIDLVQNALQTALNKPDIRDELLCLLIKFTNSNLLTHQIWRLFALCLSLFSPSRYPVMWLLRKYLHKKSVGNESKQRFSSLCKKAFERCCQNGPRVEPPSRLEVIAFLMRDPCEHSMPHSIPVLVPDGSYQVIGFDGSSTVEECAQRLCQITNVRPIRASGYCIYAEDPKLSGTLQPLSLKEKICDSLSRWEKSLKEVTAGKVPTKRAIQLSFKRRFYWRNFADDKTDQETVFQAYDSCQDVKNGHIPVSLDLAVEICALLAQLHFGPCSRLEDTRIEDAIKKCLPEKLLNTACKNTLRRRILDRWLDLEQTVAMECASNIVQALRVWPYFGSRLFEASIKWKSEEPIWLAVSDIGITLLDAHTMEQVTVYPYESVLKFGGLKNDFVIVVYRNPYTENECSQERLVFGMEKLQTYEATLLIADYIKNRRGTSLKQTFSFSPRRQPTLC